MNSFLATKLAKGYYEPLWSVWVRRTKVRFAPGVSQTGRKCPQFCPIIFGIIVFSALLCVADLGQAVSQPQFAAAEESFKQGKLEEAFLAFEQIAKHPFASPRDLAYARCRIGIIQSMRNQLPDARKNLEISLGSGALQKSQSGLCQYALLQLYVLGNLNEKARSLVMEIGEPQFAPLYVARIWALSAEVGSRLKDNKLEVISLQRLLQTMEGSQLDSIDLKILGNRTISAQEVRDRLGIDTRAIGGRRGFREHKNIGKSPVRYAQAGEPGTPATPTSPKISPSASGVSEESVSSTLLGRPPLSVDNAGPLMAWQAILDGKNVEASQFLQKSMGQLASLESLGIGIPLEKVLKRMTMLSADSPRTMRVGVVLSNGSTFTRFNSRILRAVSAFLNSSATEGVHYSFIIKYARPDVGGAEEAALSVILDDAVHAIVGPVAASQTMGVLSAARLFSVPVFSLGPVPAVAELDSVFLTRMGILARSQAKSLVDHLKGELNFETVGILAPNDTYGLEMASAFQETAKEKGLVVTQKAFFDVEKKVFQDEVLELLGPQDMASRKGEFDAMLSDLRKKAQAEKRKFDLSEVKLPAKVPFDAVFIPESLAKVKIIASTFAFNEAREIRYLGDKQWEEGTGSTSLVDPFLFGARVPVVTAGRFLPFLQRSLGSGEAALSLERQAFDSLILLRNAQYRASGNVGKRIVESLRNGDWVVEGASVIGPVDATGEPFVRFSLQSYKSGRLVPALPHWPRVRTGITQP